MIQALRAISCIMPEKCPWPAITCLAVTPVRRASRGWFGLSCVCRVSVVCLVCCQTRHGSRLWYWGATAESEFRVTSRLPGSWTCSLPVASQPLSDRAVTLVVRNQTKAWTCTTTTTYRLQPDAPAFFVPRASHHRAESRLFFPSPIAHRLVSPFPPLPRRTLLQYSNYTNENLLVLFSIPIP